MAVRGFIERKEGSQKLIHIREFDPEKDVEKVEDLERRCEVGASGSVALYTDLLGDPVCRIRHSPAYIMLVRFQDVHSPFIGQAKSIKKKRLFTIEILGF
jgi:hypothetical protein